MRDKTNLIWGISLIAISIAVLVLAGSNIIGIELPDILKRIIRAVDLIALPFLVYSSIKKGKSPLKNNCKFSQLF